jgi:hypothetical protein
MFDIVKNLGFLFLVVIGASSAAFAQDSSTETEFMHGYYYGFIDATIQPVYKKKVCPKDAVDDTIKKFKAYAKANPEKLSLGPPLKRDQVLSAMETLYPCSATKAVSPH